jgi:hypothetical protein
MLIGVLLSAGAYAFRYARGALVASLRQTTPMSLAARRWTHLVTTAKFVVKDQAFVFGTMASVMFLLGPRSKQALTRARRRG